MVMAMLTIGTSCADFPDPSSTVVESYSFTHSGQDQKGYVGEYLADSLVVNVYDQVMHAFAPEMIVSFEVKSGGGEVDPAAVTTNLNGNALTRWRLGNAATEQTLLANIFTPDGNLLGSMLFRATGFTRNGWSMVTYQPDISLSDMVADTLANLTLAIGYGGLYQQGERFFDWNQLTNGPAGMLHRILAGSDGALYIATWDGRLHKSINHGLIWTELTKPWPDYDQYFQFQITGNDYLWVTAPGRGLRCSRDGGLTWQTDTQGLPTGEMLGDVFRLTDGTLFFHSMNSNLSKSTDDGHTWTRINAPPHSLKLYVTDQDELILFNQVNGLSIHKSTDGGANFVLKKSVSPMYFTVMEHTVHRMDNEYYLLIPGYGILRTTRFEQFTTFWLNNEANDMLVDAGGNFLVRSVNYQQVYYLDNP